MHDLERESTKQNLKSSYHTKGSHLFVYENQYYRWITFSDGIIQGVMERENPAKVVAPIVQAFLLFLLTPRPSTKILNLGLGTGAIERAIKELTQHTSFQLDNIISVELSEEIVNCAKTNFEFIPSTLHIGCAEKYIYDTGLQFDVILLDIIHTEQGNDFLQKKIFWKNVNKTLSSDGQIIFNFNIYCEHALLYLLKLLNIHFQSIHLIEFHDYKNIIISAHKVRDVVLTCEKIENTQILNRIVPQLSASIKKILKL